MSTPTLPISSPAAHSSRPSAVLLFQRIAAVAGAALVLASCGLTPPPQKPPPLPAAGLPRVVGNDRGDRYNRAIQTGADTYVRQTGYRTFRPSSGKGPTVELLGAIHIAETRYYETLQQRLDRADLVLYEGVSVPRPASHATDPVARKASKNPVYKRLADALDLVGQDTQIRYDRPHFERCDLSWQEMSAALEREIAAGGEAGVQAGEARDHFAKLRKMLGGRSLMVKAAMWMLESTPALRSNIKFNLVVAGGDSEDNSKIHPRLQRLIKDDRDAHVMNVLGQRLKKPGKNRHIVVFYGSGHLAGMERRLRQMGYVPSGPVRWIDAITTHPSASGIPAAEVTRRLQEAAAKP